MCYNDRIELPTIKNTKVATHPHAVFTSRPLSSLIRTALALQHTQLNCLSFADYITRENLFNIMNKSIQILDHLLKLISVQVFDSNNKSQSLYRLYENMKNEN
ncbi:16426_t:CDS:2, partial [Gigaspora rosea]